jgi:hypothetical protein
MQRLKSHKSQRGAVAVLVAIAMGALILTAGLALDMGHLFLNKTRLQNTVDAAALAAARTLDDTGSTAEATVEARDAFQKNAAATGNRELATAYANGTGIQVTVEYSDTLPPFNAGAPNGPYVRVRATGFVMPAWLVRIGGIFQKTVSASAVAGPRTLTAGSTVCNVAPMMVCGDPAGGPTWGYTLNAPQILKTASSRGQSYVGPGNFQLVRLSGSTGGSDLRQNMAGSFSACMAGGSSIETEPGNSVGPVAQGLNTRFGEYQGPVSSSEYPPDVIVDGQSPPLQAVERVDRDPSQGYDVYQGGTRIDASNIADRLFDYNEYIEDLRDPANYDNRPLNDGGIGAFERRVLAVPVGNCNGTVNGQGTVPLLGFACFFLLQPATHSGNDSFVYGQFVENCSVTGTPGPSPTAGNGPDIIQLYDDPASTDS